MTFKAQIGAVLMGFIIAGFCWAQPAGAGTCAPVKAKGIGKNVTKATEDAQDNLKRKAKNMGGKVMQTSSNCVPGLLGTICKIEAVVCPK
jgi:hypothetical protein